MKIWVKSQLKLNIISLLGYKVVGKNKESADVKLFGARQLRWTKNHLCYLCAAWGETDINKALSWEIKIREFKWKFWKKYLK